MSEHSQRIGRASRAENKLARSHCKGRIPVSVHFAAGNDLRRKASSLDPTQKGLGGRTSGKPILNCSRIEQLLPCNLWVHGYTASARREETFESASIRSPAY